MFYYTGIDYDLNRVLADFRIIKAKYDFHSTINSIGLTHMPNEPEKVYGNCIQRAAQLLPNGTYQIMFRENQFSCFNEEFKDTIFYNMYNDIQSHFKLQVCRMRLMLLKPKTCLSFHRDTGIRFHYILYTNPKVFFIYSTSNKDNDFSNLYYGQVNPYLSVHQLPADGKLYSFDSHKEHTVVNASETESRVHLVITTTS